MTNAERQQAYRDRQRNGTRVVTGTVTAEGVTVVTPVTRSSDVVGRLRAELNEAHAEIARLKRLLAAAHAGSVAAVVPTASAGPWAECIHGALVGSCRKLGCRAK